MTTPSDRLVRCTDCGEQCEDVTAVLADRAIRCPCCAILAPVRPLLDLAAPSPTAGAPTDSEGEE